MLPVKTIRNIDLPIFNLAFRKNKHFLSADLPKAAIGDHKVLKNSMSILIDLSLVNCNNNFFRDNLEDRTHLRFMPKNETHVSLIASSHADHLASIFVLSKPRKGSVVEEKSKQTKSKPSLRKEIPRKMKRVKKKGIFFLQPGYNPLNLLGPIIHLVAVLIGEWHW